jgi:hypothetical protein
MIAVPVMIAVVVAVMVPVSVIISVAVTIPVILSSMGPPIGRTMVPNTAHESTDEGDHAKDNEEAKSHNKSFRRRVGCL